MTQAVPLFFPIEVQNRELDFRLFLAGLCAKPGRKIFVGQHDTIYRLARRANGGVYVGKNLFRADFPGCELDRYQTIKKNNIALVHLHEEGLPFEREPKDRNAYLDLRLDTSCLAADDVICTWGDYQRDYYRSLSPPCRDNIVTTGHPRFDLCTPAYRDFYAQSIKGLQEHYGDFVLINTNLIYWSSLPNLKDAFSPQMGYEPTNAVSRVNFVDYWGHMTRVLVDLVRVATHLSATFSADKHYFAPPSERKYQLLLDNFQGCSQRPCRPRR